MDMYSSQNRSVAKGPIRFESEAALEAFIEKSSRPRVRMSVEGFNPYRPEDEIKRELVNHFESCGEDFRVIVPADPIVDSRFGIMVKGYDTSLPADEVESVLRTHFSSCGEITHVYISTPNNRANIYFSEEEGEALALGLHGSEVRGFRITTRRLATVRSNPLLAPGQTRRIGYTAPAHLIEFAPEIRRKVMAFKRIKRTMKKVMAFKRMKRTLKTSLSLFYHLAPSKAQCMMTLLFVCVWMLSCGEVFRVIVPTDFIVDRRAFVILLGHGAEEKALQLNGSDIGDWNALVKHATNYCSLFGIAVLGYDTSLPEDEIESKLTANFSSCGKITHVFVCPLDECTNIYFSKEEGEASALDLNGSEVGGFKITTMRVATVRSNPPLAPGETRIGYSIPAHFIEFARENEEKLNDYMTK
ncbi:hypothetical protein HID58_063138 [Brassica napus]|uniref:RRM domain-containing protein n=1 Tax=Brassica napus TaxID=3708 RepID=A0ABQ8A3E0_BRANA|nr:hypothetical protein HID58_063138 [Brassica napus]